MTRLLSTKDVCEIYGVSRETVRLWRNKGCPYIYKGPRRLLYDPQDIHYFITTKTSVHRKVIE